ncbi:hypothetical protein Bcep1808_2213 [Burkholderia vietnamiensis G4]|uniref:Uncharacterized protein n=1 Tax=Burkholderia vietnamiensis (strain G4 / LMG 22486) TaxID=269482 RepID=A4JG12_BURVG|nr:hypothetical protein Bcep1808_2213 [Burkholderia vietnamiensis G4]
MSSTFCALHNGDKLSIKQRVNSPVRNRFQSQSHMLRGLPRQRAVHHRQAQVNLTGTWNVMLLFRSKSASFRCVPWRRAAAVVETDAIGPPSAGSVLSPL